MATDCSAAMVVWDIGSFCIRSGLSTGGPGCFPSVIGHVPESSLFFHRGQTIYYCDRAVSRRGSLSLTRVVQAGSIAHWAGFASVLEYIATESRFDQQSVTKMVVVTRPFLSGGERRKIARVFLETFPLLGSVAVCDCTVILGRGINRSSAQSHVVVVDIGCSVTSVVPVIDGVPISWAGHRLELGGDDVVAECVRRLRANARRSSAADEHDERIARNLLRQSAYVALDYRAEMLRATKGSVSLETLFGCVEMLFNPTTEDALGISAMVIQTIRTIEMSLGQRHAEPLEANVVVVGALSQTQMLQFRLQKDIVTARPSAAPHVRVTTGDADSNWRAAAESVKDGSASLLPWGFR